MDRSLLHSRSAHCSVAAAFLLVALRTSAGAQSVYVVDSTIDAPDANPGDSICASAADGCTLRAAVEEANASAGTDSVQLEEFETYTLGSELAITHDMAIQLPYLSATIDGAGMTRILHVYPGVTLGLGSVVLQHGTDPSASGGGALLNEGTVHMGSVVITDNHAPFAAGIRNLGTLRIETAYINYNGPGAAIVNDGYVEIHGAEIAGQTGVAVENRNSAFLERVQILRNAGGGIWNHPVTPYAPSIEIDQAVLFGNTGRGAIWNDGHVYLKQTTVSGNSGADANAVFAAPGSFVSLESVTIGANGSSGSPAAALDGVNPMRVAAVNSIVAGNASSSGDPDCRVTVVSNGYNLMSCPLTAPDITSGPGDPRLAPLKPVRILWPSNSGTTLVHGLLPGSRALDRGGCYPSLDQRGLDRPRGVACDRGAVEMPELCTGGVGMTETRMAVRRSPDGTTIVKVRGQLLFSDPALPVVDPVTDGLQLRIEDVSGAAGALVERTFVTDPLVGTWRSGGTGRFKLRDSPSGRLAVVLTDARARDGVVDFGATAKAPMPAALPPYRVTVVLGGDTLGGNDAGAAGACAIHVFQCTSDPTGARFKCS